MIDYIRKIKLNKWKKRNNSVNILDLKYQWNKQNNLQILISNLFINKCVVTFLR